jgi:LemA protein
VFFAGSLGFHPRSFFELNEAERAATRAPPQVKF